MAESELLAEFGSLDHGTLARKVHPGSSYSWLAESHSSSVGRFHFALEMNLRTCSLP